VALATSLGANTRNIKEVIVTVIDFLRRRNKKPKRSNQTRSKKLSEPPVSEVRVREDWRGDPEFGAIEASRCRALLLEIIRRAIHDWILYRNHAKLEMKERAESAYIWLFEEDKNHSWYHQREKNGSTITSFVVICELLDIEASFVRARARKTTIKQIMTAGRPAERRRPSKEVRYEEHDVSGSIGAGGVGALESPIGNMSSYEAHFATHTPGYA